MKTAASRSSASPHAKAAILDSVNDFISPFAWYTAGQLFELTHRYVEVPIKFHENKYLLPTPGQDAVKEMSIKIRRALNIVYWIKLVSMTSHKNSWQLFDIFLPQELQIETYGPYSCEDQNVSDGERHLFKMQALIVALLHFEKYLPHFCVQAQ